MHGATKQACSVAGAYQKGTISYLRYQARPSDHHMVTISWWLWHDFWLAKSEFGYGKLQHRVGLSNRPDKAGIFLAGSYIRALFFQRRARTNDDYKINHRTFVIHGKIRLLCPRHSSSPRSTRLLTYCRLPVHGLMNFQFIASFVYIYSNVLKFNINTYLSINTSVGVSEYSFTRSTDTMFVSSSLLIRTIQLRVAVTLVTKKKTNKRVCLKEISHIQDFL